MESQSLLTCPACRQTETIEELDDPFVLVRRKGNEIDTTASLDVVVLICSVCGHVMMFNEKQARSDPHHGHAG